jgi:hypothetical protein
MIVVRPWVGGAVEDDVVECMVYLAKVQRGGVVHRVVVFRAISRFCLGWDSESSSSSSHHHLLHLDPIHPRPQKVSKIQPLSLSFS